MIRTCSKCDALYESVYEGSDPRPCPKCNGESLPTPKPRPLVPRTPATKMRIADYAQLLCEDAGANRATMVVGVMQNGVAAYFRVGSDDDAFSLACGIMSSERQIRGGVSADEDDARDADSMRRIWSQIMKQAKAEGLRP